MTFHLANEESFKDYHDNLNGQLYDISASRSGETYTVLFFTQQTHNEMKNYFRINTSFKQKKQQLWIRLWRNSIFQDLTAKLTPYVPQPKQETPAIGDDDDVVYSHTDTPLKPHANNDYHTSPGRVKTACNKMIIKLRSPEMNESFASPSTPAV